ncbi:MAG: archease [Candidatus Omnitrophica bacterium]|nr:archease [Candidatus Omnitrophota bacterium]
MQDYEWIDHTGDMGIRIVAPDVKTLFFKAAQGMFSVMAEPKGPLIDALRRKHTFNLQEQDLDSLMILWLSELLSVSECEHLFFVDFEITHFSFTEICAVAWGIERQHFHYLREVKAVTYHDFHVDQKNGEYRAEIIFDL